MAKAILRGHAAHPSLQLTHTQVGEKHQRVKTAGGHEEITSNIQELEEVDTTRS